MGWGAGAEYHELNVCVLPKTHRLTPTPQCDGTGETRSRGWDRWPSESHQRSSSGSNPCYHPQQFSSPQPPIHSATLGAAGSLSRPQLLGPRKHVSPQGPNHPRFWPRLLTQPTSWSPASTHAPLQPVLTPGTMGLFVKESQTTFLPHGSASHTSSHPRGLA